MLHGMLSLLFCLEQMGRLSSDFSFSFFSFFFFFFLAVDKILGFLFYVGNQEAYSLNTNSVIAGL